MQININANFRLYYIICCQFTTKYSTVKGTAQSLLAMNVMVINNKIKIDTKPLKYSELEFASLCVGVCVCCGVHMLILAPHTCKSLNVFVIVCECDLKCVRRCIFIIQRRRQLLHCDSPCVQTCGHINFHVRVCSSDRQTDPLSTLSTVKYELLRCYETRSLWLNLH